MAPKKCSRCSKSFPQSLYPELSEVCRFCATKEEFDAQLAAVESNKQEKNDDFKQTIETLNELIQANIGCNPTSSSITGKTLDQARRNEQFRPVNNGAKLSSSKQPVHPIHCDNKYALLEEDNEESV